MSRPQPRHRPLRLQTRLMAAVIGIVGLILVVVAAVTSATLGSILESRLDQQLRGTLSNATQWTNAALAWDAMPSNGQGVTAESVLNGKYVPPGMVLLVTSPSGETTGAIVQATSGTGGSIRTLEPNEIRALAQALSEQSPTTLTVGDYGSYRVAADYALSGPIVVGLSRSDNLRTLADLFLTIALATLGGLILLAATTAITIRMSLRPLRAVTATAIRVAGQPLAEGSVSITERVPPEQADPRTETGAVGASLNVLLDHVDSSLAARHHKEEQMRRFVADASHELRTPLASIRGYSELSLRALDGASYDPDSTRTALERIQAQSLRMTRLVEDLLLLARLDEGQELAYGTVDLVQLALESLADAQPTGPGHHWSIEVPEEPVIIVGDAGRLHQVAANLLANARTHTPDGTTITLRVSQEGDAGVLTVHDDGPGIAPALQEELFSRFARGDASRARQTGGTGLGLAIAKAIVEGHRGTISVQSVPGSTAFTVRIPTPQTAQ